MKKKIFINTYLVMASICAMTFTACANSTDVTSESAATVPLQLSVLDNTTPNTESSTTRSTITTTTLPDGCDFGIFVVDSSSLTLLSDGNNVGVSYSAQYSKLYNPVLLSDKKDYVFAYYPYSYSQSLQKLLIETNSQTDYLYGYADDGSGKMATVNRDNPKASIRFKHAMARLVFNITQDAADKETNKISMISVEKVPTGYTYDMTTQKLAATASGSVTVNCNITASTSTQSADMLVLPVSNYDLTIGFNINGTWTYKSLSSVKWGMGQQYTYTVNISNDKLDISEPTITPRTNYDEPPIGISGEVENVSSLNVGGTVGNIVDLGLSVKWSDHNIGADSPEDYGGLYGWGDPTGIKTTQTNDDYPSASPLSNICGTIYDIAHVQWGGNWRLPTLDELNELINNCTWNWTNINGVTGYKVVSIKNGNSIFLPCAGYRKGTYTNDEGSYGHYWSGTLSSTNTADAYLLYFNSTFHRTQYDNSDRFDGHSVRPVCNE